MTVAFERDADDLRLIMQHYLDAGNQDRIYSEQGDCSENTCTGSFVIELFVE